MVMGGGGTQRNRVTVTVPGRRGEAAFEAEKSTRLTPQGPVQDEELRLGYCSSCGAVFHNAAEIAAACSASSCSAVLCAACATARCRSCGRTLCRRHARRLGSDVLCSLHVALGLARAVFLAVPIAGLLAVLISVLALPFLPT